MRYLLLLFFVLYFKEFYSLLTFDSNSVLDSNLYIWAISHYEGWIIILSFVILLSLIQSKYQSANNEDSSNVLIFNLLNLLVLKKLLLRKRYVDQLYFISIFVKIFDIFKHDLVLNMSLLKNIVRNEITISTLRKLDMTTTIHSSSVKLDRIYLI